MAKPFDPSRSNERGSPSGGGRHNQGLVSISAARAALSFLEETGSPVPKRIRKQCNYLYWDLLRDLGHSPADDTIVMTPDQLRGIVASALIVGTAQAVMGMIPVKTSDPTDTLADNIDNEECPEPALDSA